MPFELGERVVFRGLQREVAKISSTAYVELFGRERENQGLRSKVIRGLEPMDRPQPPVLSWTLGNPGWDAQQWLALHDAFRLTLSHYNVFGDEPRLIMSMCFAAQDHIVDDLKRVRWGMGIIDEAHHVAERRSSTKALTELARVVSDPKRSEALMLLTGTPHDGKGDPFASLIGLLDPFAVVDPDRLDPAIVRPLIVRRLRTQVIKADGTRFRRRKVISFDIEKYRTDAERRLERELRQYMRALRRQVEELEKQGRRNEAKGASFLETFLRKRLASSSYACSVSLHNRLARVQGTPLPPEDDQRPEDRSQQALGVER